MYGWSSVTRFDLKLGLQLHQSTETGDQRRDFGPSCCVRNGIDGETCLISSVYVSVFPIFLENTLIYWNQGKCYANIWPISTSLHLTEWTGDGWTDNASCLWSRDYGFILHAGLGCLICDPRGPSNLISASSVMAWRCYQRPWNTANLQNSHELCKTPFILPTCTRRATPQLPAPKDPVNKFRLTSTPLQ